MVLVNLWEYYQNFLFNADYYYMYLHTIKNIKIMFCDEYK